MDITIDYLAFLLFCILAFANSYIIDPDMVKINQKLDKILEKLEK